MNRKTYSIVVLWVSSVIVFAATRLAERRQASESILR